MSDSVLRRTKNRLGCILSCCFSCSYCSFSRASAKERSKARSLSEQNKACQRCMLYKSLPFCPTCFQCPQCCPRTECRGKTTKILESLASHGFKSSGSLYPQGGLHSSLQTKAPSDKVSFDPKRLCQPQKKHVLKRSSHQSHGQIGGCQVVPRLLQPAFSGSQTQRQMETHIGSESAQFIPQHGHFQDGFLMYLFQERKLQPSVIDGYRSAIDDKLGNSPINISKDENVNIGIARVPGCW